MAAMEFRLPDTPPQGHTFPPPAEAQGVHEVTGRPENAAKHSKKPSLTINTTEVTLPPQQQVLPPPPPPRTLPNRAVGKPRSNSQPVHSLQMSAGSLPSPPPRQPARKRESTGNPMSVTPTHSSMFPRYNPAAPGEPEASHAVTRAVSPPPAQLDLQSTYTHSIYSTARSPPLHQGASLSQAFAAPTEPAGCALPSYRESMYGVPVVIQSTPTDVMDLWCLANGQDDQELALSYNLGLDCTDLTLNNELICLTSTAGTVYALRATSNALNVTRTHPFNGANTLSVAAPTLYTPSETSQLLTTVFPVLAKISAIDEAASLAISHALDRSRGLALEREAITKAHANTAAPVMYSKETKSYYISLPQYSYNAESLPAAPSHHILPIEINPNISIRVLEPPSAQSTTNPILTLSLHAKTLIIHSHALANLPTPYGADILISSMMILLLHLHRQSGILSSDYHSSGPADSVPTFAPPPTASTNARSGRSSGRNRSTNPRERSSSRAGSRLANFLHPNRGTPTSSALPSPTNLPNRAQSAMALRPQASAQLRAGSRLSTHSMAATTLHGSPALYPPGTPGLEKGIEMGEYSGSVERGLNQQLSERGTAPELSGAKTGVDLSRFQAYDLADPRLGGGTRAMLRVLYWTFGVLVWILGVWIGILAEVVVVLGSCGGGGGGGGGRKK